jgi:O-antigen/teichoic acid export membrane protein
MREKITRLFFSNRTRGQTIVKNLFWLSISQVASRLLRAIIVIYAARALGAAGYGVFSYGLAIGGLLALGSDIGVNWVLVKEGASQPQLRNKYLATTFFVKILLLSCSCLIMLLVAPTFAKIDEARILLPVLALLFFSDGLREFGFALVRSTEKMEMEAIVNIFTNIFTVSAAMAALLFYPSPYNLAIAYTGASLLGSLLMACLARKHLGGLVRDFDRSSLPYLASIIWPLAVANLLWSAMAFTDILMLGWLRTAQDVGWYAAAQRPIQLLLALPLIIATSILPTLSRLALTDLQQFRQLLERGLALTMMLAMPLAGGTWLLSPQIVALFYGSAYAPTADVFKILALGFLITFPWLIIGNALFAQNLQRSFLPHLAVGAILNILLNWYTIPRWGATGSAVATVIAQIVSYGWVWIIMRRRDRFTLLPQTWRMLVATMVMMGAILIMQSQQVSIYWVVAGAVATYGLLLTLMSEPLIRQLRQIWQSAS